MNAEEPYSQNWRIEVEAYMMPESSGGRYERDWLKATLRMHTAQGARKRVLRFLGVEELEHIAIWLKLVRNGHKVRYLEMLDPGFGFMLIKRNRFRFIKVMHGEDPKSRLVADQWTTPEAMKSCIAMIEGLLAQWPCRCGYRHDLDVWPVVDMTTFEYPGLAEHLAATGQKMPETHKSATHNNE